MEQKKPEVQQLKKNPYQVMTCIYESRRRQILEASKQIALEPNAKELQDQMKSRYLSLEIQLEKHLQVQLKEKNHNHLQEQNLETQRDKQRKERKYKRFMEKAMCQSYEQRFCLPTLNECLFYHEQFMKKHQITLAKLRRILKEVTHMNLMCSSWLDQILAEEKSRGRDLSQQAKRLRSYYDHLKDNIKQYFPNDYEGIINFFAKIEPATAKQIKRNNNKTAK